MIAALQRRTEIADEVFKSVRVLFRAEYMTIDAWNCNRFEPEATSTDFCSTDEEDDLRRILDASLDLRREADRREKEKSKSQDKLVSVMRRLRKVKFGKILRRANGLRINRPASQESGAVA